MAWTTKGVAANQSCKQRENTICGCCDVVIAKADAYTHDVLCGRCHSIMSTLPISTSQGNVSPL